LKVCHPWTLDLGIPAEMTGYPTLPEPKMRIAGLAKLAYPLRAFPGIFSEFGHPPGLEAQATLITL